MTFPRRLSSLAFVVAIAALVVVIADGLISSGGSQRTVRAEFGNVRGLLVGNEVMVNGAPAGAVTSIDLTTRGTAMVTVSVDDTVPRPRSDAAATVRPLDLLGDIYLDYSPGATPAPLRGPIPIARTGNVPRLADLLRAFTPGARAGAQALIVALGRGLESRGVDLNEAALRLAPALAATDRLTAEASSQNATLRSLISNAAGLTHQLAAHEPDLSGLVTHIAATFRTTAADAPALDRGLAALAPSIAQLGRTTGELAATAHALRPLAVQLGAISSPLATTLQRLAPFLQTARPVIEHTRPTIRSAATVLHAGRAPFAALTTGLRSTLAAAPQANSLLTTLTTLAPLTADVLFQNVASETSEPGNQPLAPGTDRLRNYWRGAGVLSCESFGLRITPGCLSALLSSASAARDRTHASTASGSLHSVGPPGGAASTETLSRRGTTVARSNGPARGPRAAPAGTAGLKPSTPAAGPGPLGAVNQLLNYLLGP